MKRALFFCFLVLVSSTAFSETRILTSIRPLALIAQELALPSDTVIQLFPVNFSPHHYQLKPSDRNAIDNADLTLWVGPELEVSLAKLLSKPSDDILTISKMDGIHWPKVENNHKHDHHGHHHDQDPHVWLDPRNLMVIADQLTAALVKRSPNLAEAYKGNNAQLQQKLQSLDKQLLAELKGMEDKAFVVMHPAYGHYVERYGLKQLAFIVQTPERGLGAKHMYELRKLENVKCVFGEEGQSRKFVGQIADHLGVSKGMLDPLGIKLPEDSKAEAIILSITREIKSCLKG